MENEIAVDTEKLPRLVGDQKNILEEFIVVLEEVRRVASLIEADREVEMSRAPRLLLELYETLMVMEGKMRVNDGSGGQFQSVLADLYSRTENMLI